jgi:lipid A 3-O-deacylase
MNDAMRRTVLSGAVASLAVVAAACLPAARAHAQDLIREVKVGVLYHDMPYIWSGFQLEPKSADVNFEVLFKPSLPFLIGSLRPALGATVNTVGATSHAYLDARWDILDPAVGLFFAVGAGGAIHNGDLLPDSWNKKALGSRELFHFPAELGWRFDEHNSLSLYFEHTSNAWLARYNEGLDRLGVRYGYRF